MLSRVGVLLACVLLCLLPVPASAAPTPCVLPPCPTTPPPTPSPTHTPSPTPSRTVTPTPSPTRTATHSPRPRVTRTTRTTSSSSPVETAPPATDGPFSSVAPVTVAPGDKAADGNGRVDNLVALILGGALLLGIGGVSGLYLTRERDEL